MKKFLGNVIFGVLCGLGSIGVNYYITNLHSGYPFCVKSKSNNMLYKVDRVSLSVVTDLSNGQTGFAPVDPEQIRSTAEQVSCPKN